MRGSGRLCLAEAAGVVACEYAGATAEEDEDGGGVGFNGCELEGELKEVYIKMMFRVMGHTYVPYVLSVTNPCSY